MGGLGQEMQRQHWRDVAVRGRAGWRMRGVEDGLQPSFRLRHAPTPTVAGRSKGPWGSNDDGSRRTSGKCLFGGTRRPYGDRLPRANSWAGRRDPIMLVL